jgi:hypothetical protein
LRRELSIKEGMLYPLVPLLSDGSLGSRENRQQNRALLSFVFCIWATNATWKHLPPSLLSLSALPMLKHARVRLASTFKFHFIYKKNHLGSCPNALFFGSRVQPSHLFIYHLVGASTISALGNLVLRN